MKQLSTLLIFITCIVFLSVSCKRDHDENAKTEGQISFTFSETAIKNSMKSSTGSDTVSGLTWIVFSVEDATGKVIKNMEKIELYNMNGTYISKPISLVTGSYKLTKFFILDWKNNVVYASPLQGSKKAYLVQTPLPIPFDVKLNTVTKITPQVLSTIESTPEEFGYVTFGFEVLNTFDFLIGTFVYNETVKNYELTTADISILSGTETIYTGQLKAISEDSSGIVTSYDSIGVTNKITLPETHSNYTLVISKAGYQTYNQTFTKEELKLHLRSVDKGPLIVILEKQVIPNGLVAYYKFNGDVQDYSGLNNHGTYLGRGLYTSGILSNINTALALNGSTDYVKVSNAPSLNPTNAITVTALIKPSDFVGSGNDAIVDKPYTSHVVPFYQYHLGIAGDYWNGNKYTFGFSLGINGQLCGANSYPTQWAPGNWYFVVGTYDGITIKIYVNGSLAKSVEQPGTLSVFSTDLFLGKGGNVSYYTPGDIDEIRIYNRALSQTEITALHQEIMPSLSTGLVGYYKFNGDVLDYSGNKNNGTCYGRNYYTSGRDGSSNAGLDLNGSTDYVVIKNSSSLNFNDQITICGWYRTVPFSGCGSNPIVCKGYPYGSTQHNVFGISAVGNQYPSYYSSAFSFGMSTTNLATGIHSKEPDPNGTSSFTCVDPTNYGLYKWYFVAGTYNGSAMKLYVNGKLVSWKPMSGSLLDNTNDIYIGNLQFYNNGTLGFLPGSIDEVRIYNRALADAEITNLYELHE